MPMPLRELLLAYARLGLSHWSTESQPVKNKARKIGVEIATKLEVATRAVVSPFIVNRAGASPMKLIPMPCKQNKVHAAFFAPWLYSNNGARLDTLSFDLVVLQQHGAAIAFRFEPGLVQSGSAHGYDHVQLSESLARQTVPLSAATSPLPTTYPAFPIRSDDPVTRFLAMAVAMHGFPKGVDKVINDAFKNSPNERKHYFQKTVDLINP